MVRQLVGKDAIMALRIPGQGPDVVTQEQEKSIKWLKNLEKKSRKGTKKKKK